MIKKYALSTIALITSVSSFAYDDLDINDTQKRNDFQYNLNYQKFSINDPSNLISKPYVIGGDDASISTFPFYARLTIPSDGDNFFHVCGGSILSKKYILTAAHCVDNVDISRYAILINKDSNEFSISDYKYINTAYVHPDYNSDNFTNDIAILELSEDIVESFTPISIASETESSYYSTLSKMTVIGMGQINKDNENPLGADHLKKVELSIISDDECFEINGISKEESICTSTTDFEDSCYGDSGGPLTYNTTSGYKQAGLVSHLLGTNDSCASSGNITVYTEVSGFSGFIEEITGVKRDVNGDNDSTEPNFINSTKESGGALGFLSFLFVGSISILRRKSF